MNWTEETTRQYLNEQGIKYHEYLTVNNTMVLDYKWCPYRMLLAHGELGDSGEKWEIVAVLDSDTLILRSDNVYQLASRDGWLGDAQVGGTLEGFVNYLRAWSSMANTPGPFGESEI